MSDRLDPAVKRHWHRIPSLMAWLASRIPAGAKVLDVGPSNVPFERATVLADLRRWSGWKPEHEFLQCDITTERLPFSDKHFDFVFCRHMLEDVVDPFSAMREMERVGRAGYIETPSPITELCRYIDGGKHTGWRGYHHHRWIAWAHEGELRFVTKYPIVEYVQIEDLPLAEWLREGARWWNTYHLWTGAIRFVHRNSPDHFAMPHEYQPQLRQAIEQSKVSIDAFWSGIPDKVMMPQIGLNRGVAA